MEFLFYFITTKFYVIVVLYKNYLNLLEPINETKIFIKLGM